MTTFSQLVDSIVAETRRPDMLNEIISYTNQTLRELHFDPEKGAAIFYSENLRETLLRANVPTGFGWSIPDPGTFQAMQAVKYLLCNKYVPERVPSRALAQEHQYYYRTGGNFVFSGYEGLNAEIALAYFAYTRRMTYYAVGSRPAQYDPDLGWTYVNQFAPTQELRISAQQFTSNWLLLRWVDVVLEGVRAKVYKRVSDTDRARTCYSLYSTLRVGLVTAESAMLGGFS